MKITEVQAMRLNVPASEMPPQGSRRAGWSKDAEVANPMSRYANYKRHRSLWAPAWGDVWCKVTLENGWLVPSDSPGFGLEIDAAWLTPYSS